MSAIFEMLFLPFMCVKKKIALLFYCYLILNMLCLPFPYDLIFRIFQNILVSLYLSLSDTFPFQSNNVSRSVVIGLVCGVAFCVGFLVMCLCFFKFCCNGPSISPQLYNYKPYYPNDPQVAPSPPTTHRAKKIFVADWSLEIQWKQQKPTWKTLAREWADRVLLYNRVWSRQTSGW